jgi:hypothetical protein
MHCFLKQHFSKFLSYDTDFLPCLTAYLLLVDFLPVHKIKSWWTWRVSVTLRWRWFWSQSCKLGKRSLVSEASVSLKQVSIYLPFFKIVLASGRSWCGTLVKKPLLIRMESSIFCCGYKPQFWVKTNKKCHSLEIVLIWPS